MADQLGPLLRRLRTGARLTQEQLSERSGVSVRTIRRLETGNAVDHRLGTVNRLADALEAGPEERRRLAAVVGGAQDAPHVPVPPPPVRPGTSSVRGALADHAGELAREVARRWRREEEQRRVHDPFPLPVRWHEAATELTDHSENVQRLEPGATAGRIDLSGDLRATAEVYRRIRSGRLVVLGRAGSGKSILTIRFVLDFLDTWAPPDPVPVIFSIASWDPTATALRDWLIGRLLRDHPHLARRVPSGETLAAALVDADLILPVLDGFDEIAEGLRCEALEALNATSLPLVLTSRRGEYAEAVRATGTPLIWAAGIELADLTLDDLTAYLPRTTRPAARGDDGSGAGWDAVLARLGDGRTPVCANLAGVLSTPLMVILARTLYSGARDRDPAELLDDRRFPTEHALEEHLLAGFVPTVYRGRPAERSAAGHPAGRRDPDPSPEQAQRWLGYLAHRLVLPDRERHDLAWWHIAGSLRRSTRLTAVLLASALCVAVADWIVDLLATPLRPVEVLVQGALMGPVAGLAFAAVYGVVDALGGGVLEPSRVRLRLTGARDGVGRRPARSFTTRSAAALGGFALGAGCACAFALERALYSGVPLTDDGALTVTLVNVLAFGLIFGLAAGLVFGLMSVLEAPLDVTSAATPASLLAANRAAVRRQIAVLVPLLTLAIAGGGRLVVGLLRGFLGPMNWGLTDGLVIGAVGGLGGAFAYVFSFTAWGHWVVLVRLWLPLTGKLPWDTAAFLDDAYRRGVLRRTGAVHQFRHTRLQHHLGRLHRERRPEYARARLTGPR
ncbi:helix-turn-helix domain-containing protein [Streptantibioticus cattleyicolor]|uniref:XRE family transcriptional regulator n=1 Tax=Streptantibioticus cattleyicolor (strain ATCC 35852 / DSM 46488 / JCM 4925 / NBRC 14057 / NRRL 8057) TaxID=1003195 RepID=F8JM87_STREN|nr:helix-turn-helix transcriptional regulator [Streptantibioticus cattleyicolor]AEW99585.1 XRE family transcriptional regulator [Streptantibioticus cattleyicolor NRRL 8057 = DSM 46488]CCB71377.1 Transcriptional regulator, XRE family [Streptantibioticus cattleyicolor NRRL 8057 = DSM 46488]